MKRDPNAVLRALLLQPPCRKCQEGGVKASCACPGGMVLALKAKRVADGLDPETGLPRPTCQPVATAVSVASAPPPLPPVETPKERWNGLIHRGRKASADKAAGKEGAAEEFDILQDEAREVRALLEAELGRPLTLEEQARGVR